MARTQTISVTALLLALACALGTGPIQAASVKTVRVASGLTRPVYLTSPNADRERLFILEQHTGQLNNGCPTGTGHTQTMALGRYLARGTIVGAESERQSNRIGR